MLLYLILMGIDTGKVLLLEIDQNETISTPPPPSGIPYGHTARRLDASIT